MNLRSRWLTLAITTAVLGAGAVAYTTFAAGRGRVAAAVPGTIDLATPGQLLFRNADGKVASVRLANPRGPRTVSDLPCDRFSATRDRGLCLTSRPGITPGFHAAVLDRHLRQTRLIKPPGVPNRARLAADGTRAAWTAFVSGHGYATTSFSTRTSILDLRTGNYSGDLETLRIFRDGKRVRAADLNLWGVTFVPGSDRFYATAATGGETFLIEGNSTSWEAQVLRTNVECPSLSPDGRRLAFKKRTDATGARPWRLHVLDLATLSETALAETTGIDDQPAWLDDNTVLYARDADIWSVPATGTGTPTLLIEKASSPTVIN